ncbi:hypothetical protein IWB18_10935 [Alkalibacter sp. M17DMB]|nr:hypothetical protein [Alkalibacter mobilis]
MKNFGKIVLLALTTGILVFFSYMAAVYINAYFSIDALFESYLDPWIVDVTILKSVILLIGLILVVKKYSIMLMSTFMILSNGASLAYLIYMGSTPENYWVFAIILGIELVVVNLWGLLYNKIFEMDNKHEEPIVKLASDMIEPEPEQEFSKRSMEENEKEIAEKNQIIGELKNELAAKNEDIKAILQEINRIKEEEEFKAAQSISCPIRIDIGIEDLKKCFSQYNDFEKGATESKVQIPSDHGLNDHSIRKDEELEERARIVKAKEKVIEQTILNLEQISKTIKERMALLEEKEEFLKKQLERVEEREDDYTNIVHTKIYEMLFNDPDILAGEEVKLKDNNKEIIIDKNDLSEIRKMIEQAVETDRRKEAPD